MEKAEIRKRVDKLLEPIKKKVLKGKLSDIDAMSSLARKLETFSTPLTKEFQKFKDSSKMIYAKEPFSNDGYRLISGIKYHFLRPSEHDIHTLFKIWQHRKGEEFSDDFELQKVMMEKLSGREILELGCGPGYNLEILRGLGGLVYGLEKIKPLADRKPEIIQWGDAKDLTKIFPNKFDIIYSRDLFCDAILKKEDAMKIMKEVYNALKFDGIVINQITYARMDISTYVLAMWLYHRNNQEEGDIEELFWHNFTSEDSLQLYSNTPSLTKEDYEVLGFKVLEYSVENGELNIVLEK